jgi:hypothetical protein
MKTLILLNILFFFSLIYAQTYEVDKLSGKVNILNNGDDIWQELKLNTKIGSNAIISTDKNSFVKLNANGTTFTLKEFSAISVSDIKIMSINDLLLALAMENIINAPRKKENNKSNSTAVYGTDEQKKAAELNKQNDMGIKRLNGAKQLAENGMVESAIITAKEIYRKYPETKSNTDYRIYFADLLFKKGLYEEAFDDFSSIKSLPLNNNQKVYLDNKLEQISKKLLNK